MNINPITSNFGLSQSFTWLPHFHENAIDLGALLRKKYPLAHLSDDTKKLAKGDIYVLYSGKNYSTIDLLYLAKKRQPVAVIADNTEKKVIEEWCDQNNTNRERNWTQNYFIESLKNLSGFVASAFYLNPSKKIIISAVTGTNGKTTVVNAAAKAFANCDGACASLGTLGLIIYKKKAENIQEVQVQDFGLTTPSSIFLHRYINYIVTQGIKRLIIEASSIGLVQGRLLGCQITHAALTNIGHDHLDFHGSLKELEESKTLLFKVPNLKTALFVKKNQIGPEISKTIVGKIHKTITTLFVSVDDKKQKSDINLMVNSTSETGTDVSFEFRSKLVEKFRIPTIGKHNIENAAVVAGLLSAAGKSLREIAFALKNFKTPRGRMDFIEDVNCPLVCVDYAHTPDAFTEVLSTLKLLSIKRNGRLLCVFGCGGERDKSKRSLMGGIASKYCEGGCITSDNPRSENAKIIIEQILMGINSKVKSNWLVLENRRVGIREVILNARANDVILVAGKGHENYQIIKTKKIPFSDLIEVESIFQKRKYELGHIK